MKKYVAYYRVSTAEQGKSGLGLSGQRRAVLEYINGGAEIIKEYKEVESGTKERPMLNKAITYCKEHGATLVVSKMDRLARSVWLFEKFKKSGIDYEIVGLPKNPLVQQVLASVAEFEAKAISERTKTALAEKKAQGKKLGSLNPNTRKGLEKKWRKDRKEKEKKLARLTKERQERKALKKARKLIDIKPSKREQADMKVLPQIKILREQGFSSEKIAKALAKSNVQTRSGGKWSQTQVIRIMRRNNIK